jgi:hypothetical protein
MCKSICVAIHLVSSSLVEPQKVKTEVIIHSKTLTPVRFLTHTKVQMKYSTTLLIVLVILVLQATAVNKNMLHALSKPDKRVDTYKICGPYAYAEGTYDDSCSNTFIMCRHLSNSQR